MKVWIQMKKKVTQYIKVLPLSYGCVSLQVGHRGCDLCRWCRLACHDRGHRRLAQPSLHRHPCSHPVTEKLIIITSAPIGAWKYNFPPLQEIIIDRPTDRRVHREVTLPSEVCMEVQLSALSGNYDRSSNRQL